MNILITEPIAIDVTGICISGATNLIGPPSGGAVGSPSDTLVGGIVYSAARFDFNTFSSSDPACPLKYESYDTSSPKVELIAYQKV
jgi:hypothetical protein